ncbi:hypothetical protein AMTRI_Chr09g34850 [Amborella trichopoda]
MGQCVSRRRKTNKWDNEDSRPLETGCLAIAKEQRSRLYIVRRCIVMLLCWQKYGKY